MEAYHFFKDFAGAIATTVAALAALCVTWRLGKGQLLIAREQADLADLRVRIDLFDRRYEIFDVAFHFLIEILQSANISNDEIGKFVRGTRKAVFLFDQDTIDYFECLRRQAVALRQQVAILGQVSLSGSPEYSDAPKKREELLNWFSDQFDELVRRLKPVMALDKGTATRPPRSAS